MSYYVNWNKIPFESTVGVIDAAILLRVHPNTVYTMIRDGRLVATKIRGRWFISKEEIEKCLSE